MKVSGPIAGSATDPSDTHEVHTDEEAFFATYFTFGLYPLLVDGILFEESSPKSA